MIIHDVSMLIEPDMMVYKDKPSKKPVFENMGNHSNGVSHESKVSLDIHTGTHIDMPLHMIESGKTMDTFDFTRLMTSAKVFDMTHLESPVISLSDIKSFDIVKDDFIIFKTKNSFYDKTKGFEYDFVYVDESAARYLTEINVNGVGIDALGIERAQDNHLTHKLLLQQDIIILEGLELKDIKEGPYQLVALPIKLKGTEGSWVRAILIEE